MGYRFQAIDDIAQLPTGVAIWDSLGAMADDLSSARHTSWVVRNNSTLADEFHGRSLDACLAALRDGDDKYVARSDAILDKVERIVDMPTPVFMRETSMVGPRLHVGNYLAGRPLMAQRRVRTPMDNAPLTVVMPTMCSASTSVNNLIARGVAVLALARHLSAVRPVSLYAMGCHQMTGGNGMSLARIDTAPLQLSHASFVLADPSSSRRAFWQANEIAGRRHTARSLIGCIPFIDGRSGDYTYVRRTETALARRALGIPAGDDFLYVPQLMHNDRNADIVSDPAAWVARMIAEFSPSQYADD